MSTVHNKNSFVTKAITDKILWDNFVTSQKNHTFVHAWTWGEFNKTMGDKVWRLGIFEGTHLVATALGIKVHARRGNFLFVPHGPVIDFQLSVFNFQVIEALTKKLKELAKNEGVSFIRISPLLKRTEENVALFRALGFKKSPIHMHAETTWKLNLEQDENELMLNMRKGTRNLIKRAQKEGVELTSGTSTEFVNGFLKLYRETAKRQKFVAFSDNYIKGEIESFAKDSSVLVFLAKHQGQILSAAVIVFYGHSAYYHQGANSNLNPKIPAAYLLQWRAICEAKRRGKKYYNFWGIADDENNKKHPWHGLTFFKTGFGGKRTEYMHAQDMPLNKKYWITYTIDTLRRLRRGF